MDWARTTTHTHTSEKSVGLTELILTGALNEKSLLNCVLISRDLKTFECSLLIICHTKFRIFFFVLLRITKSSLCRNLLSRFLRVPQLAHSVAVMRSLNALQSNALASFFINGTYFFLYSHSICNFWNLKTMLICIASKIHTTIENVRWIDANPTHQVWRKRARKKTQCTSAEMKRSQLFRN